MRRLHLLALGSYILLAFILLHALLFNNGTHVAGFDYFNYHWNFWWIRHALTTPSLEAYQTDYVFAPFDNSLGLHALTAFWWPVWAIVEPLTDTFTAMNTIIVLGCVLNGFLLYLLLIDEDVSPGLAFLGGVVLQAVPLVRYFYYNTHINLMDWFWLPAHILLWRQTFRNVEASRYRLAGLWAVVQGIGLWGASHTDLQFPIFIAFLVVPYGLWTLATAKRRIMLAGFGVVTVVVTLALLWFAGPLPHIIGVEGTPGPVEERPGIPLRGYFSVDDVWWHWNVPTLGGFLTVLTLVSLVAGVIWRKGQMRFRWFWLVVSLPPFVLSLGPSLTVGGTEVDMPFRWLYAVTGGNFRFPWRLAPIFVVAWAVFVGKTWTPILAQHRVTRTWVLAGALLVFGWDARIYETGPTMPPLPIYSFYEAIGAEEAHDYVVLEVPTGVGTGEVLLGQESAIQTQFYALWHERRVLNGFISRAPLESFFYINSDDPMLAWLGQRRFLEPDRVEEQLAERIDEWPVGYIVVHQDMLGLSSHIPQEIIGYFNSLPDLLCPVFIEGPAVAYRTASHPLGCPGRVPQQTKDSLYVLDIGGEGDEAHIGWGWHWPEQVFDVTLRWVGEQPTADLYLDLPPGGYEVAVFAQAFWEPRNLRLLVDGEPLKGVQTIEVDVLGTYTYDLPPEVVGDGEHLTLTLAYDDRIVQRDVGQSEDRRALAVAVDRIEFRQR